MKKIAFLTSLMFTLGLSAQGTNEVDSVKAQASTEVSKETVTSQGSTSTQQNCTSTKSGTYTQYFSNGMLKSFSIVK